MHRLATVGDRPPLHHRQTRQRRRGRRPPCHRHQRRCGFTGNLAALGTITWPGAESVLDRIRRHKDPVTGQKHKAAGSGKRKDNVAAECGMLLGRSHAAWRFSSKRNAAAVAHSTGPDHLRPIISALQTNRYSHVGVQESRLHQRHRAAQVSGVILLVRLGPKPKRPPQPPSPELPHVQCRQRRILRLRQEFRKQAVVRRCDPACFGFL